MSLLRTSSGFAVDRSEPWPYSGAKGVVKDDDELFETTTQRLPPRRPPHPARREQGLPGIAQAGPEIRTAGRCTFEERVWRPTAVRLSREHSNLCVPGHFLTCIGSLSKCLPPPHVPSRWNATWRRRASACERSEGLSSRSSIHRHHLLPSRVQCPSTASTISPCCVTLRPITSPCQPAGSFPFRPCFQTVQQCTDPKSCPAGLPLPWTCPHAKGRSTAL